MNAGTVVPFYSFLYFTQQSINVHLHVNVIIIQTNREKNAGLVEAFQFITMV